MSKQKYIFCISMMAASCLSSNLYAKKRIKKREPLHSIEYVETVIAKAAKEVGVPFELLRAICRTESNLKADAYVYNDGGSNNHAFGICQVLRTTAEKFVGVHKGGEHKIFQESTFHARTKTVIYFILTSTPELQQST